MICVACRTTPRREAPVPGASQARTAAGRAVLLALVAVLAVGADVATKAWALSRLSGGPRRRGWCRAGRSRRGRQPHRPLDPAARCPARRGRGLATPVVLRPDLQPGRRVDPRRTADRPGRMALATPQAPLAAPASAAGTRTAPPAPPSRRAAGSRAPRWRR